MLNSIGLQNIGVRHSCATSCRKLARLRTAVFANVFGYATEDYVEVVRCWNRPKGWRDTS
jgi:dihydroorotate dehydrogenase (NAD+) catalytic subunit